jgi:hypothetical protein
VRIASKRNGRAEDRNTKHSQQKQAHRVEGTGSGGEGEGSKIVPGGEGRRRSLEMEDTYEEYFYRKKAQTAGH